MEEKKTVHLPTDTAQLFREPYCSVPQDIRTLPARSSLPAATPRITSFFVLVGWAVLVVCVFGVVRQWQEYRKTLKTAAMLEATYTTLEKKVTDAKQRSDTDVEAQQFMTSHETILGEVRNVALFQAHLLALKPRGLALTGLDVRVPQTGSDVTQWDVTMRFRTDDKTSGSVQRESMIEALTAANFTVKIQNRSASADDPESVMLNALIKPPETLRQAPVLGRSEERK